MAKFSKQSGNVKTDYRYYTQNAHGDVVNLTDSTGAITKSYKYDAFGVGQNVDDADDNARFVVKQKLILNLLHIKTS